MNAVATPAQSACDDCAHEEGDLPKAGRPSSIYYYTGIGGFFNGPSRHYQPSFPLWNSQVYSYPNYDSENELKLIPQYGKRVAERLVSYQHQGLFIADGRELIGAFRKVKTEAQFNRLLDALYDHCDEHRIWVEWNTAAQKGCANGVIFHGGILVLLTSPQYATMPPCTAAASPDAASAASRSACQVRSPGPSGGPSAQRAGRT